MITKFKLYTEKKNNFNIGDCVFYNDDKLYIIINYDEKDNSYICNFIGYYFEYPTQSWIEWEETEENEIINEKYLNSFTNEFESFFFDELDDSIVDFIKSKFNIDLQLLKDKYIKTNDFNL